jgi:hypothetical protein
MANESLASIVYAGLETPDALSGADWLRCASYMFQQFNAWEYLYHQHRNGSIPKEMCVGNDAFFRSEVETRPGLTRFLPTRSRRYH